MRAQHRILTLLSLAVLPAAALEAQRPQPPSTELDEYLRLLEISGRLQGAPLIFRPLSARHLGVTLRADSSHPWAAHQPVRQIRAEGGRVRITLPDAVVHLVYQSAYPRDVNDGALWAGRGPSAEVSGGAIATWGPLTATFLPTVYAAANADFEIEPVLATDRSPFANPWHSDIDWPQRFGTGAVSAVDWGQSGIRLDVGGFTAGVGTENMWWGPAQRYPILMSNTAAGFPHAELGTGRPVRTALGKIETRFVWGALAESPYFDTVTTNNRRFFAGFTAAIEPRGLPGLTLGLGRAVYLPWDSVDAIDATVVFSEVTRERFQTQEVVTAGVHGGRMVSFFARWVLPQSGFETYLEWARNDPPLNLVDWILEPEHSRAFTVGFTKAVPAGASIWRFRGEAADLERTATSRVRVSPPYYIHPVTIQGYTQRGQLIGASLGPGGTGQFLSLDRYSLAGRIGFQLERVRRDDDTYYDRFGESSTYRGHDVELTGTLSAFRFLGDFSVTGALAAGYELNRYYRVTNNLANLRLDLAVGWRVR